MSAIDPNSRGARLLDAQIRVDSLNRSVEDGYRYYLNEQNMTIEKRYIGFPKNGLQTNQVTQTITTNSANTFDSQNPVLWLIVALVVFVLFKLTSNQ